ncbi:MAG: hypothetical protein AAF519_19790 [Bacteroidota bacterium]
MLFKKKFLDLIEQGEIKIAFRKWSRPSVTESKTLLTPAGLLRIKSVKIIDYDQISDHEIVQAGYADRKELNKELAFKETGDIYKIEFDLEGVDPRIALRENSNISNAEMTKILDKLKRLDTSGKVKNWTFKVLDLLDREPGKYALEYSTQLGYEKEWFKLNIRKLKNLGLTISLTDGYEISPRGNVVLHELKNTTHS